MITTCASGTVKLTVAIVEPSFIMDSRVAASTFVTSGIVACIASSHFAAS